MRSTLRTRLNTIFQGGPGGGKVLIFLGLLAILGLASDAWQVARRFWLDRQRPVAFSRRPIRSGVAVSLNALEARLGSAGVRLPGFQPRGVLLDRLQNDWILFGEADTTRPSLPLDAVAVALRAVRRELEAPGVDIQPRRGPGPPAVQEVLYFGGVAGNVVGMWFFTFDHWMKRLALAEVPAPAPGIAPYWERFVQASPSHLEGSRGLDPAHWSRHTRYWLCAGNFTAIEGDDTLDFEETPLHVLAEGLAAEPASHEVPASPCASRGTDDPLATEFADSLTKHFRHLTGIVPASEIQDFAVLLAGLAWLDEQDPYRSLRPWLEAPLAHVETPNTVPTLEKHAVRERWHSRSGATVVQRVHLGLTGGVLIHPSLTRARSGDASLTRLHHAVLQAQPAGRPVTWHFSYAPPGI